MTAQIPRIRVQLSVGLKVAVITESEQGRWLSGKGPLNLLRLVVRIRIGARQKVSVADRLLRELPPPNSRKRPREISAI